MYAKLSDFSRCQCSTINGITHPPTVLRSTACSYTCCAWLKYVYSDNKQYRTYIVDTEHEITNQIEHDVQTLLQSSD